MSDLIDRQAAIDAIVAEARTVDSRYLESERIIHESDAVEAISMLPSAEPKTGRWINANEGKWNTVEVLKCTACGEMDNRMYRTDSYCPNCGAKMEDTDATD